MRHKVYVVFDDARQSVRPLVIVEKPSSGRPLWKPEPGNESHQNGETALDDEEVLPVVQLPLLEVKYTERFDRPINNAPATLSSRWNAYR